jgi:hypothetical protein
MDGGLDAGVGTTTADVATHGGINVGVKPSMVVMTSFPTAETGN